jgi:hypothetical protein
LKNPSGKGKNRSKKGLLFLEKTSTIRRGNSIGKRLFFLFLNEANHMSFHAYLWGVRLLTLLSFSAWIGILFAVDPERNGMVGVVLFFTSFFAMTLGILTLSVTWTYRKALGDAVAAHHSGGAFRQAFLLALCGTGMVLLQYLRLLTWWDAALLLVAMLLAELTLRRIFRA